MTQHIGIVACSAEGAALCCRSNCVEAAQLLGPHAYPEVSIHTSSLAGQAAGELMLFSAGKLAKIGVDFLICPDNTMRRALAHVEPRSPLSWLNIAEIVAEQAGERGFRRVGLIGTRWLVESTIHSQRFSARGLHWVIPNPAEEIHRIIIDEPICGVFRPASIADHQRVVGRMQNRGCDAVILGCTEIALIINESNSPLPTLDSTRLLARAALSRAIRRTTVPS